MSELPSMQGPVCPLPLKQNKVIVIGHGSGGVMTHDLITTVFQKHLGNELLNAGNDSAIADLAALAGTDLRLVVSTDAHIVTPLVFPGGDIGRLAVCGTVNDVSMLGATPLYLTASFILEEGLEIELLESLLASMAAACAEAGVRIIAADTKVAGKGQVDQLFITTTGIGLAPASRQISGAAAQPGDMVLVSGTLGDHGIAIAQARGDLGFQSNVRSDTAPLNGLVAALLAAAPNVHVLRDPTRGGLATTLVEITRQSGVTIEIEQQAIPINKAVRKACELLGFDPLYLANEGKLIAIVPEAEAKEALEAMRAHPYGKDAAFVGRVTDRPDPRLLLRTELGTTRILEMLAGEMLPRIC